MFVLLDLVRPVGSALRQLARQRKPLLRATALRPNKSRLLLEPLEDRTVMHANPVMDAEHAAVMALVPLTSVTDTAINSGDWDDPNTWDQHRLPRTGDNVLIATGVTVRLDTIERNATLHTLRIDGTLTFATNVNTGLLVDTIVETPTGSLIMGTAAKPIQHGVMAKIIIADTGAIDTTWDPKQFSRGLITHGHVSIFGDATTSFVSVAQTPTKGSTQITLSQIPVGWDAGERIIVTGTNPNGSEDEELAIASISGNTLTLSAPLKYNHATPLAGTSAYVSNMSRNAVIESQNPAMGQRRGHVMFMHNPDVDVEYAGFYGLGRTDKRNPLASPLFDANGVLMPDSGKNTAGRYAVHFHRTGTDEVAGQGIIKGSAVVDSPGWGFVNHSSNVDMEDNVAFNVTGAAFVTETGEEIGIMNHNLAIKSTGSGRGIEEFQNNVEQSFGHQGDGFWFQGGGVVATNNIAVGQKHSGFVFFTRGLNQKGLGVTEFHAENLTDPSIANGAEHVAVGDVPFVFKNNTSFANGDGMETWFHLLGAKHSVRSLVENFTAFNNRGMGMFDPYTNQMTIRNVTLLNNENNPNGTGMGRNDVTRNLLYDNVTIKGFGDGIQVPVNGTNTIQGGHFNNVRDINISTANSRDRVVNINGDIDFGQLNAQAAKGKTPFDIYLKANFDPMERDVTRLFNPDVIKLGTVKYNGKQVYYNEQAAGYVPFPKASAAAYIPPEFIDKTNQQLWDQYGLAPGGIVAPANAITDKNVSGLIGDPATYLPDLYMTSRKYTNQLAGYVVSFKDAVGAKFTDATPVTLREGWNVITRTINGQTRSFLVYGDITAPTFTLDPKQSLRINPVDLKDGLVIKGTIFDDSFGTKNFAMRFSDLDKLPTQVGADGLNFVTITFTVKDQAGNATTVSLNITIDPKAALQQNNGFVTLPEQPVSVTLAALLGFPPDPVSTDLLFSRS
ncbi:MAG TPA: G8 domain-containing protein [Gemmatales bacterium]|nr:G8 domain-containing protein [Gemmatales bacterium]